MTRIKDIKLRIFAVFMPVILPSVYIVMMIDVLIKTIRFFYSEIYQLHIDILHDFLCRDCLKFYLKSLWRAVFDWKIGAVMKVDKERRNAKIAEMYRRDFGNLKGE